LHTAQNTTQLKFTVAKARENEDKHMGYLQQDVKHMLLNKGKAIPLQALTSPEGSRRLRLQDFKTISA
jgi:hypothetical protein